MAPGPRPGGAALAPGRLQTLDDDYYVRRGALVVRRLDLAPGAPGCELLADHARRGREPLRLSSCKGAERGTDLNPAGADFARLRCQSCSPDPLEVVEGCCGLLRRPLVRADLLDLCPPDLTLGRKRLPRFFGDQCTGRVVEAGELLFGLRLVGVAERNLITEDASPVLIHQRGQTETNGLRAAVPDPDATRASTASASRASTRVTNCVT
ncbi:MAG: hypothetical protein LC799_25860 [Actinobacteria bacterium]|nr:hypothetical protein [Actinomycetota bacterium]